MEAYIMNKINQTWTKDGFVLRLAQIEDAEAYFQQNFNPLDSEVARLTGCKEVFTHDEVVNFFMQCVDDDDRYDFLIINPDGRIIGESVINEIDWKARSANFRIAIFQSAERGKGIGSWAIKATRDFAFEKLKLHRLELDVFSFNPSAEKAYQSAGFKREGVLRDAIWDGKEFADDVLMAILEDEWKQIKVNS
ncbi:GNAT family protein [Zhenhengia yiwuensis]|uniref:GNAT family N-acetyltransferase n=1 Tax=Zhenhengia yiwuensis TaxID=2763666 RepID=UPI002A759AF7|nr:GNAT family protein [Zhenhengia yiwuensis]MDY3367298.1 GNAT family protein [Zhenhengia yiwuensis]